ncbi:hypothetical protein AAMO2058_000743000 [Amorphochlora amoebiformis]
MKFLSSVFFRCHPSRSSTSDGASLPGVDLLAAEHQVICNHRMGFTQRKALKMLVALALVGLAMGSKSGDNQAKMDAKPANDGGSGPEKGKKMSEKKTSSLAAVVKGEKTNMDDEKLDEDEIKELFDRFDEDSNGYLNRKELFQYFVATTPPDSPMGQKYKQSDYFNLARYRKFCESVGANPLTGLTLKDIISAYSKHYGYAHKDWVITAGMRSLKIPKKEKDHVKDAFAAHDGDINGYLNWPEIQKLVPQMKLEQYERLANDLKADVSEGVDLHGILKAYTRKKGPAGLLRSAIRRWVKPPEEVIVIERSNKMAIYILVVFFLVCLVAPILAWACGVHKTVQGRRVVKQAARQMQEIARSS